MSIKTISIEFKVGVATVHRIIHKDRRKICAKLAPGVLIDKQKEIGIGDSREMIDLITPNPRILESPLLPVTVMIPRSRERCSSKASWLIQKQEGQTKQGHREAHDVHRVPSGQTDNKDPLARQPTKTPWPDSQQREFCGAFAEF